MSRIVVFGVGYVGLVQAVGLAELGHDVVCVDVSASRIAKLDSGRVPFFEPDLEPAFEASRPRLLFRTELSASDAAKAEVFFVAVGTPPCPDGSADLSYVMSVGRALASRVPAGRRAVVAVKSTVPVGTCERLQALLDTRPGNALEVASNPEFLREGSAMSDFRRPDRVVIGARRPWVAEVLRRVYAGLDLDDARFVVCDPPSSELAKYAANTMLAARLSMMNELSRLCEAVGGDVGHVRRAVALDHRLGPHFLATGPGYGGSCFPKDVQALVALGEARGVSLPVARATHVGNEAQREHVLGQIVDLCGGTVRGARIALLGLAFKADTDDVRESAALWLAPRLTAMGAELVVHDPQAVPTFREALPDVPFREARSPAHAVAGAHLCVVLTEWAEYREVDLAVLRHVMSAPRIYDARNLWRDDAPEQLGFEYRALGSRRSDPARAVRVAA